MIVAFGLHVVAVLATLAAPFAFQYGGGKVGAYWCLYAGQLAFSLGNGTCEAVINPLTATLFPKNKTHWLNILHAGWPGGLVLGALVALTLNQLQVGWEIKWGIVLAPMLLYGVMMVGRPFPKSEAKAAGVTLGTMIVTLLAPILLFLFLLHALIGYVELGTDSWIINITNTVLENKSVALLAFIWTNVLMFTLRFFAGPIVHRISPVGLLFVSALLGTCGLLMLGLPFTNTAVLWLLAVTVYGIGKTFFWPTMLGVISERYPQGGALALGVSAGIGMISAGFLGGPLIGYKQDFAATRELSTIASPTYTRYRTDEPKAPLPFLPGVAGLDNGKVGVLEDYNAIQQKAKLGPLSEDQRRLQLQRDLELLAQQGRTDESLEKRLQWWLTEGEPHAAEDTPKIREAQLSGGKWALTMTAFVPGLMAIGYLLLFIYFRARGGYKAEVLTGHAAEDERFTGGVEGPGEG
jgi:MFS family permease